MAAVISVCETLYITLYIIMYTCTVGCTVSPTAASNKRNPGQGLLAGRCELCAEGGGAQSAVTTDMEINPWRIGMEGDGALGATEGRAGPAGSDGEQRERERDVTV